MSEKMPRFDFNCLPTFLGVPVAVTLGGTVDYGYVRVQSIAAILPAHPAHSTESCRLFLQGDGNPLRVEASIAEVLDAIEKRPL